MHNASGIFIVSERLNDSNQRIRTYITYFTVIQEADIRFRIGAVWERTKKKMFIFGVFASLKICF